MKKQNDIFVLLMITILFFSLLTEANCNTDDLRLTAPDGSTVNIYRDSFGVPHIYGESEIGVFFGQGFAVAQDRLYQMDIYRRVAEGRVAEVMGDDYLDFDKDIRTLYYTKQEREEIFQALPVQFQAMLRAYRDGVNTYLDSMEVNPLKYKPSQFFFIPMKRWTVSNSVAVMQFMIRNFGHFGGDELKRLRELQLYGKKWLDINRPINDPSAPTTIPGGGGAVQQWTYSGMFVRDNVIQSIISQRERFEAQAKQLGIVEKFGSFAVLIKGTKSYSGNVMLLGCPQMGTPKQNEPQINNEVELFCPTLHVGGMTVTGIPSVIIGHNEYHAWSLTSGISDNSDVYIDSTLDNTFSKYYHNNQWLDFEVIRDTIVSFGVKIPFTHYRTIHGPVFGEDLENHQVFSMKMSFWKNELGMIKFILGLIRATNLEEFEAAASLNPMSFNLFYAGKDQNIKYWHTGWYQDRSDGVDPRLPHKGDGGEEWGGLIDFSDLPSAENPQQGYFVNWNNKPVSWWNNGDNCPWVGSHHVTRIDNFVGPINTFTYDNLKDVPRQIGSHGTYQQAIELSPTDIFDENILPPGQSDFISIRGVRSPHCDDQWPLHLNWEFKDMEFGYLPTNIWSETQLPLTFSLRQNYPNPFNPLTTISYQLPHLAHVSLAVYNIDGQLVKRLVNRQQRSGEYRVQWRADGVSSGIYFYRFVAGEFSAVKKCMVLK